MSPRLIKIVLLMREPCPEESHVLLSFNLVVAEQVSDVADTYQIIYCTDMTDNKSFLNRQTSRQKYIIAS